MTPTATPEPAEIKLAFVSCREKLATGFLERMRALYPELPLWVVSEFPPAAERWIPYRPGRGFRENLARCRAAVAGRRVRLAGVVLEPNGPYWPMRWTAFLLSPLGFLAFNENLNHFMLRPRCLGTIVRHCLWRVKNFVRWQTRPGGTLYTWLWRLRHPHALRRPWHFLLGTLAGVAAGWVKALRPARPDPPPGPPRPDGISVVVPSRSGRALLERLLPGLARELEPFPHEIIVVDNGSEDGSAEWLAAEYPRVSVEVSAAPLSFAAAVNRGIRRARFSHVCLLNNDMVLEPGFFPPLRQAFERVPDLLAATAQILFPEGMRRQETGKAFFIPLGEERGAKDFPIRCEVPLAGEDLSYVLYPSGGCSLYDAGRLARLGGLDEAYVPAYVEDLDLGWRGWQRGWPTVFVAGARVTHYHRATTSKFYKPDLLASFVEYNWLRFLARRVCAPKLFGRLWREALDRLNRLAVDGPWFVTWPVEALEFSWKATLRAQPPPAPLADEEAILALTSGVVAVFPGRAATGRPRVLIASPYPPYPLSHGGAVRMYNLMREAARDFDLVLVTFVLTAEPPPGELLDLCVEIVTVRRRGTHLLPSTDRPEVVEEFASAAFRAALVQMMRKWRPAVAQLEFTQMAQYAADCAPAKTLLVEHDITVDLYQQMLENREDWETRRQYERWIRFETAAWRTVDCVVTMSEKDRRVVQGARRVVSLANGVDLERFLPPEEEPGRARLLFLGAFRHLPNLMAVDFFLREAWPLLAEWNPTLHLIAGARHRDYLKHYRDVIRVDLEQPGIEVEDFVADVRPAYRRATVVVAPLVASAGTNIKIMEAMAMGKAIVSTPAGINGLDELEAGRDVIVTRTGAEMAAAVARLLADPAARRRLERQARETVAALYDWRVIGERQRDLYHGLVG